MLNIKEVNNKVFEYLEKVRLSNSKLRYTFRKSNYNNRLSDGYWFYGTEQYMAVSFWTGMDWRNRTPNICFFILENGVARLEINVSDSDKKRDFIERHLVGPLNLFQEGRRYFKDYSDVEEAYLEALSWFLEGNKNSTVVSDKFLIDAIITEHSKKFFKDDENGIGFIDQYEFRSRHLKVLRYKDKYSDISSDELDDKQHLKSDKIIGFKLKSFAELKDINLGPLSNSTNWVFITGENGSGKTTLLRSIGTALGYRLLSDKELQENPRFNVSLDLFPRTESGTYKRRANDDCSTKRFPMVSGLALYGPNRLDSTQQYKGYNRFLESIGKKGLFKSLFEKNAPLLDIESQFVHWTKTRLDKKLFDKKIYYIKNALISIVPGLYDIRFEELVKNKRLTKYILRKNEYDNEKGVVWDNLPSGTKSVLGLVSDILIRLSHYQKKNNDLSDLKGVVIIDEVDLHLHPKAQKALIQNLAECFPNVQFIVTTHSPIPLLGAPENSAFFKMYKDEDENICIMRLEKLEKEIKYLTPNTLLTSDFFDLEDIEHIDQKNLNEVYLEDTYEKIKYNKDLKQRLTNLDASLLPDNLFD